MRLLRIPAETTPDDLPEAAVVCHDVRNPSQRNEVLARKGTCLQADELRALISRQVGELHLAVPDAGDLTEDEAAGRLGALISGDGVDVGRAHFGQVSLTSSARGMLRINLDALTRVNAQDGVLLMTGEANRPADAGSTLGVMKSAPVLLSARTVEAVESIVGTMGPVLEIQPFLTLRVAFIAPEDRLRGGAFERARSALSRAVEWYGSSLDLVVATEATTDALATAFRQVADAGAELILAAGASATDPLDISFDGLREAGGRVDQIGIPAEPGTACWIGGLGNVPVLGLASCELFGRPGALDLILPRLFTGEPLNQSFVRGLALGGLLDGLPRIAPYHSSESDAIES